MRFTVCFSVLLFVSALVFPVSPSTAISQIVIFIGASPFTKNK